MPTQGTPQAAGNLPAMIEFFRANSTSWDSCDRRPESVCFSRSENAQKTGFCTDVPSSSEGIVKWFSSVFVVPPTLGKRGIWWLTNPPGFAQIAAWHDAVRAAFSNRQFICMFAPAATTVGTAWFMPHRAAGQPFDFLLISGVLSPFKPPHWLPVADTNHRRT